MAKVRAPTYGRRHIIAQCLWCGEDLVNGADVSGFTGAGPDYMTRDGDFGCDASPDSGSEGVGSHTPNVMTTWDGHVVKVSPQGPTANVEHKHDW